MAALVLADTRAEADTPEAAEGRHRSAAQVRAGGTAGLPRRLHAAPGRAGRRRRARRGPRDRRRQDPEAVARALEALAGRADRRGDLAGIAAPALVIVGSEDALTPPPFAETLAAGLPDAELVVIPGAGHLTALERPAEFAAAVRSFLSRRLEA